MVILETRIKELERERDEARAAANANKAEYTLAFGRVQNLQTAYDARMREMRDLLTIL